MRYTLYFILLLFTFISVFAIHLKFLPEFKHFLIQSYIVNILMALLALFLLPKVTPTVLSFPDLSNDKIGFIFNRSVIFFLFYL